MPTIQENIKAKQEREIPKVSEPKRFIFKAFDNFTLVVRGQKSEYVRDETGKPIHEKKLPAIKVVFQHGTVELNPVLQRNFSIPIEDVAKLMTQDPNHGWLFRLIWAPKKLLQEVYGLDEPSAEMIEFAQRADQIAQGRIPSAGRFTSGARAEADLTTSR